MMKAFFAAVAAAGRVYQNGTGQTIASNATKQAYADRGSLADASGHYFTKSQPQYTHYPASAFASVKDAGARGTFAHAKVTLPVY